MDKIVLTVCIAVCKTEKYLPRCLESLVNEDFKGIQLVVVDDGGIFKQKKEDDAKFIVKTFAKKHKEIAVDFIKHDKNMGLVESRRTALYAAKGDYIFFADSDDTLLPGALSFLYKNALLSGADIIHATANVVFTEDIESPKFTDKEKNYFLKRKEEFLKKAQNVFFGSLADREILDGFLLKNNHSSFMWAKLFKKELLLKAFEQIPLTYCCMSEEFLIYFYTSLFAKKYYGIKHNVYNYFLDTGITSAKKIESLEDFRKISSAASAFTILLSAVSDGSLILSDQELDALKKISCALAYNNLCQLRASVIPSLQDAAYEELCSWWGKGMIEKISRLKK